MIPWEDDWEIDENGAVRLAVVFFQILLFFNFVHKNTTFIIFIFLTTDAATSFLDEPYVVIIFFDAMIHYCLTFSDISRVIDSRGVPIVYDVALKV